MLLEKLKDYKIIDWMKEGNVVRSSPVILQTLAFFESFAFLPSASGYFSLEAVVGVCFFL